MNLICAQNGLGAPSRTVPQLMTLACEVCVSFILSINKLIYLPQAKLKQLITHALTLSSTSTAISSINPSHMSSSSAHYHFAHKPPMLTAASLQTLFTISPADLPNKSAAAMRFALSPTALVSVHIGFSFIF